MTALRTVAGCWLACAGLLAGCDGPARPEAGSSGSARPPARSPSSSGAASRPPAGSPSSSGLRPERLRDALVGRFGKAILDRARDAVVTFGEPLAWGKYGSLDHAVNMSVPITPAECGDAFHAIGPAKEPAAPAAAISLQQDDSRSGGELLVATSPANIAAELRYRIPAKCHRIGIGRVSEVAQDLPVAWPGGQARGMTVGLDGSPGNWPATVTCTVFFPTGHGRLLGEAYFIAPTQSEACRAALALAHAADRKAQKLI